MSDAAPPRFSPDVVEAICRHMNVDHPDDCLRMVQGLGGVQASAATMTGLDDLAAFFTATTDTGEVEVVLPWSHQLTERAEVRTEVVVMHEQACRNLGIDTAADEGH
jgi:putative heme iron utilization protein